MHMPSCVIAEDYYDTCNPPSFLYIMASSVIVWMAWIIIVRMAI